MTRRGQDVSHLHCQSRTNNMKFVIFVRPYLRAKFVTSTRFGIHAHAHTHTCGRTPHLRHTFALQAFPETGLGWQNAQYNRARNHGDAERPRKTCLVIYCCIFISHCRQAAFCSSSSTGVTPKPTSHLNAWPCSWWPRTQLEIQGGDPVPHNLCRGWPQGVKTKGMVA